MLKVSPTEVMLNVNNIEDTKKYLKENYNITTNDDLRSAIKKSKLSNFIDCLST